MDGFEDEVDEEGVSQQDDEWTIIADHHKRTIIHIDVDCFYAQVEMVRNPCLRDKPLGIKQKNLMVTCNYVARSLGVKKCMYVKEALEILPNMVVVDGSDLTHYRHFSSEIFGVAQTFSPLVERLGMDENFVDVTDIIEDYVDKHGAEIEGHVFGDKETVGENIVLGDPCGCGCFKRLTTGTYIAQQLRQQIYETTGITCCAGVGHNKLLAKLVSGYHKPNQQTVLFPWQVHKIMSTLSSARSIPGIGSATYKALEDLGIFTIQDLQNSTVKLLRGKFDEGTCVRFKKLSFGIDESAVRKSGQPQSIGLEDAFQKVIDVAEVRVRFYALLERLLKLLAEDGRIPASIRVSVRKFDKAKRFGQRETKQVSVSSSLFSPGVKNISEAAKSSLMNIIMILFKKMVDTRQEFHLTLIGIGFNKFIERAPGTKSISSFFSKCSARSPEEEDWALTTDLKHKTGSHSPLKQRPEVQCFNVSSCFESVSYERLLSSDDQFEDNLRDSHENLITSQSTKSSVQNFNDNIHQETRLAFHKDIKSTGNYSSESFIDNFDHNVSESALCSNSSVLQDDKHINSNTDNNRDPSSVLLMNDALCKLPVGIDKEVFIALPKEMQDEIFSSYKKDSKDIHLKQDKLSKSKQLSPRKRSACNTNRLDNYFKTQNNENLAKTDNVTVKRNLKILNEKSNVTETSQEGLKASQPSCSYSVSNKSQSCIIQADLHREFDNKSGNTFHGTPLSLKGIDMNVFSALPKYMQQEILEEQGLLKQNTGSPQLKNKSVFNKKTDGSDSILKYFKKL